MTHVLDDIVKVVSRESADLLLAGQALCADLEALSTYTQVVIICLSEKMYEQGSY